MHPSGARNSQSAGRGGRPSPRDGGDRLSEVPAPGKAPLPRNVTIRSGAPPGARRVGRPPHRRCGNTRRVRPPMIARSAAAAGQSSAVSPCWADSMAFLPGCGPVAPNAGARPPSPPRIASRLSAGSRGIPDPDARRPATPEGGPGQTGRHGHTTPPVAAVGAAPGGPGSAEGVGGPGRETPGSAGGPVTCVHVAAAAPPSAGSRGTPERRPIRSRCRDPRSNRPPGAGARRAGAPWARGGRPRAPALGAAEDRRGGLPAGRRRVRRRQHRAPVGRRRRGG